MAISWTRAVLCVLFIICLLTAFIVQNVSQRAIALATAGVLLATIYLYGPKPPPAPSERLPAEDFSVWIEAGDPFSRIENMSSDLRSAANLARQDLGDLNQNLDLLASRLEIIETKGVGVRELKEMVREVMRRVDVLSREFPEFPGRAIEKKDFLLGSLDHCSTNLKYVSEKLLEISKTSPPEISTSLGILQVRSSKLAEDFQKAKSHLVKLLESIKPPAPVSPAILLPELKPVEVRPEKPPEAPPAEEKPPEKPPEEKRTEQPPEKPPEKPETPEQPAAPPQPESKPAAG